MGKRVYCVDWSEDDEACIAKAAGWSLHLSVEDAARFLADNASPDFGQDEPYEVEVPDAVYEELRRAPHGVFRARPRQCPYPPIREP